MIDDEMRDDLVTAARDFVFDHMAEYPTLSKDAREWLANPNYEDLFHGYFKGNGFRPEEWAHMTQSIENIHVEKHGRHGIYISFDFAFESDDGSYQGERQVSASF